MNSEIDFRNVRDVIFWSKKWEISPTQLIEALLVTRSKKVSRIENFLRTKGVAV